jgi:hypothetical protein
MKRKGTQLISNNQIIVKICLFLIIPILGCSHLNDKKVSTRCEHYRDFDYFRFKGLEKISKVKYPCVLVCQNNKGDITEFSYKPTIGNDCNISIFQKNTNERIGHDKINEISTGLKLYYIFTDSVVVRFRIYRRYLGEKIGYTNDIELISKYYPDLSEEHYSAFRSPFLFDSSKLSIDYVKEFVKLKDKIRYHKVEKVFSPTSNKLEVKVIEILRCKLPIVRNKSFDITKESFDLFLWMMSPRHLGL